MMNLHDAIIHAAAYHAGQHGGVNGGEWAALSAVEPLLRQAVKTNVLTEHEAGMMLAAWGVRDYQRKLL